MAQKNFFITGIVRDADKTLARTIDTIDHSFRNFGTTHWFVVESDSIDKTIDRLEKIKETINNFSFVSLGHLQSRFPNRIDRLAYCRNQYLQHFFKNNLDENCDFLVVADLDGMNLSLESKSLESCWENNNWDACFANQDGPYYDIYALRHSTWSSGSPQRAIQFFRQIGLSPSKSVKLAVYNKMIKIPRDAEWIEVESAFGGLGIYRPSTLKDKFYKSRDNAGNIECEHVLLHEQMRQSGYRLFINPTLINDRITEHTRHARGLGYMLLKLKHLVMDTLFLIFGKKIYKLSRKEQEQQKNKTWT